MMRSHARVFLPVGVSVQITIEQAFIRTGFIFAKQGDELSFGSETKINKTFLNRLLAHLEMEPLQNDRLIYPAGREINQSQWMGAWQELAGGAEGGPSGLMNVDLSIMDAFLAGIARWLTALGYDTQGSCDGHGRRLPRLYLKDEAHAGLVTNLVERHSRNRITYASPVLCPDAWQSKDKFYLELLGVAESLYGQAKSKIQALDSKVPFHRGN